MAELHLGLSRTLSGLRRTLHVKGSNFGENTVKGSIFLAREGRGDEGFEFLRVDSGFREKGSSICEKAMKGSHRASQENGSLSNLDRPRG